MVNMDVQRSLELLMLLDEKPYSFINPGNKEKRRLHLNQIVNLGKELDMTFFFHNWLQNKIVDILINFGITQNSKIQSHL